MSTSNFIPIGGAGAGTPDSHVLLKATAADFGSLVLSTDSTVTSSSVSDVVGALEPTIRFSVTDLENLIASRYCAFPLNFALPDRFVINYRVSNHTPSPANVTYLPTGSLVDTSDLDNFHGFTGNHGPGGQGDLFTEFILAQVEAVFPPTYNVFSNVLSSPVTVSDQVFDITWEVVSLNGGNSLISGPQAAIRLKVVSQHISADNPTDQLVDKNNIVEDAEVIQATNTTELLMYRQAGAASWSGRDWLNWAFTPLAFSISFTGTVDIGGFTIYKHPSDL